MVNVELIRAYIHEFDPRAAMRMARRLIEAGDSLRDFPELHTAHPEEPLSLSKWRLEGHALRMSFETRLRLRSASPQDERR